MKLYYLRIGWQEDCYGLKKWPDIIDQGYRDLITGVLIDCKMLQVRIPHSQRWAIVKQMDIGEIGESKP